MSTTTLMLLMLFMPMFTAACNDDMPVRAEFDLDEYQARQREPTRPKIESEAPKKPTEPRPASTDVDVPEERELGGRIDLNKASLDQLMTLPGVGPAMAKKIDTYRTKRPFRRVRELKRIRGVGPRTFEKLKLLVEVTSP